MKPGTPNEQVIRLRDNLDMRIPCDIKNYILTHEYKLFKINLLYFGHALPLPIIFVG